MSKNKSGGGAGSAKHGRNLKKCERYRASGRAERNKVRRARLRARDLGHGPIKKPSKRSGSMGRPRAAA